MRRMNTEVLKIKGKNFDKLTTVLTNIVCSLLSKPFSRDSSTGPSIDDAPTVDISLVVPAYNEELRLGIMMDETLTYLKNYCSRHKLTFEVRIII